MARIISCITGELRRWLHLTSEDRAITLAAASLASGRARKRALRRRLHCLQHGYRYHESEAQSGGPTTVTTWLAAGDPACTIAAAYGYPDGCLLELLDDDGRATAVFPGTVASSLFELGQLVEQRVFARATSSARRLTAFQ